MTATQKLHDIIRRDIETGSHAFALNYGHDWFNLTRAEADVFGLELHDLPSLVAVWTAYEAVLDISNVLAVPPDVAAGVLAEHPWLAARASAGGSLATICMEDFQNFAKLFGVPFRKSHAWYTKHEYDGIRARLITFKDEYSPQRPHAPQLDDDIPF